MLLKDSLTQFDTSARNNGNDKKSLALPFLLQVTGSTQLPELAVAQAEIKRVLVDTVAYTSADLRRILALHQAIAGKYGVTSAYFNFTHPETELNDDNPPLLDETVRLIDTPRGRFKEKIFIGSVGQLPPTLVAAIVNDQIHEYLKQGTMGEFPRDDEQALEELTAIMLSGFSPTDVLIHFSLENNGLQDGEKTIKPLSGARIIFGASEKTVRELNGSPDATLPTLSAVRIDAKAFKVDENSEFANTPESEVFCVSRLFSSQVPDVPESRIPRSLLVSAYVAQAVVKYAHEFGLPDPKFLVYDTSNEGLINMLKRMFDSQVVARNGQVQATQLVQDSALRHHYDGLRDQIHVAIMRIGRYLELSLALLQKCKMPIPQDPSPWLERTKE